MKFDAKTIEVLKNFSTINPSIKFVDGTVQKTISPNSTIMAKATVTSNFDNTFCIGELSRFMSALSLFSEPNVITEENKCTITDGKNKIDYIYTAEKLIKTPPDKEIVLPSNDIQFTMTNEMFQSVRKAMAILSLNEMAVVGDGKELFLQAYDSTGTIKDTYTIAIGETKKKFRVVYRAENLKIMPYDYEVSISEKGLSQFKNPDIEYFIAIEKNSSKFE